MRTNTSSISILLYFLLFIILPATPVKGAEKKGDGPPKVTVEASAGLGYDSNIYQTPGESYIDYSQTGNPLVVPEVQTGFFIPVKGKISYATQPSAKLDLIAEYLLRGQIYPSEDNGNEYTNKISAGGKYLFKRKGSRKSSLYAGLFFGNHKEVYVDHDTGLEKTTTTTSTDISDRYVYNNIGLESEYKKSMGRHGLDVSFKWETRDYEDELVVSQLDHQYISLGGSYDYDINKSLKFYAGYTYANRDYDERKANNLDGSLNATVTREYVYHILEASLRHRLNKELVMYYDLKHSIREDQYVGYHDYSRNDVSVRALYEPLPKLSLRGKVTYWKRDYDNAYAFDNPAMEQKEYDGLSFSFKGEYELRPQMSVLGELKYNDRNSTDTRYDYDGYQLVATVEYKF